MIDVSPELLSFLQHEETRARNEDLLERAETALKSYNGDYYGDEIDGCSKVVSRDVAEVVDHMNVSVLRAFVSGDRVVEFEPDSSQMEQVADDATEVMHRDFQSKGYQLLHDWLKEGNISTLGVVKVCVEKRRQRTEIVSVDPEADEAIEADIIPESEEIGVDLYKAIVLQDQPPEFRDYMVPLEEFRIAPDARDVDDAVYVAHASMKSLSELKEMGFDDVDDLQSNHLQDTLGSARDVTDFTLIDRTGVNRRVMLLEEYIRFDADNDGIAERLCVHRVGNTVLRIEPTDYQPFVIYCPFPMPGRLAGHSLADKVTDIQRINTAIMRIYLDTQYLSIAPRMWVPDDCVTENTYDDLLTVIAGSLVRGKGPNKPEPLTVANNGESALQAIEFMIGQRESRTGITRHNQGLDADTLNHTATGMALQQASGEQIGEYLARNFAEAVSRLMRLKLKLKKRYGQPLTLRVDGQYREIDPSKWPEDMQTMIRVGLGSGRKEQRLQNRMALLEVQKAALEGIQTGALDQPIVNAENIYKSIAGVVRDANLGSPADYVTDPETFKVQNPQTGEKEYPPKPPQPDPAAQKVQADAMIQAHKVEGDQQMQAAKLQGEREASAAKLEMAREEAALTAQLAREKAEAELILAREKFEAEVALNERKMEMEFAHRAREADMHHEQQMAISKDREGGKLDA